MALNTLNQIKQSFDPYLPFRWEVSFSDSTMNIAGNKFPAKEVNFDEGDPVQINLPLIPGVSINYTVAVNPVTSVEILFLENASRAVYNALKIRNERLKVGVADFSDPLKVTIVEFNIDGTTELNRRVFVVQLSSALVTSLAQSAIPYEAPLTFNVVGEDTDG